VHGSQPEEATTISGLKVTGGSVGRTNKKVWAELSGQLMAPKQTL